MKMSFLNLLVCSEFKRYTEQYEFLNKMTDEQLKFYLDTSRSFDLDNKRYNMVKYRYRTNRFNKIIKIMSKYE